MKNRNVITIALVSVLISCVFVPGCSIGSAYILIDSRSDLMKPTLCLYWDPYFKDRLKIGTIVVSKAVRSPEETNRWELDARVNTDEKVWQLEYKTSGFFLFSLIKRLFGRRLSSPVFCLTYGEVPPGYEEKIKALPLEPEALYIVWMEQHDSPRESEPLRFIIRLNETGAPDRLEYRRWDNIFDNTNYYLRLY